MRQHSEDAGPVEPNVGIEVGHVVEHGHCLGHLVESRGLDLHPRLPHRRDAEQDGITQSLRDVEQLLGVDEPAVEGRREARRLRRVKKHSQQRGFVTEAPSA